MTLADGNTTWSKVKDQTIFFLLLKDDMNLPFTYNNDCLIALSIKCIFKDAYVIVI